MDNKFKIGDEVIALTNQPEERAQPRVKGQKYIVEDVMYCHKCGVQTINLGVLTSCINSECQCGDIHDNYGKHWTNSKYFIKPENISDALEDALSNEDYEFAITLRDLV